jgi:hypothetical protein
MTFPNPSELISAYDAAHHYFLMILADLNSESTYLPYYAVKAYFKFRHNVFSCLFKMIVLNLFDKLETDADLSEFGISKTPDVFYELHDKVWLLEFTVGMSYDKIDFLKGGGNTPLKYTQEAQKIAATLGKPCEVLIVPAVLKFFNFEEIFGLSEKITGVAPDFGIFLKDFFSISVDSISLINENASFSYSNSIQKLNNFNPPKFEWFDRPQEVRLLSLDPTFVCNLLQNRASLSIKAKELKVRWYSEAKCTLSYDTKSCKFYFKRTGNAGIAIVDWPDILSKGTLGEIIAQLTVSNQGHQMSIADLHGNMSVSIPKKPKRVAVSKSSRISSGTNFYNKSHTSIVDEYGTPQRLLQKDFLKENIWGKVAFPPDYYSQLLQVSHNPMINDENTDMLVNNTMSVEQVSKSIEIYNDTMSEKNSINFTYNPKQTFQFPFCSIPLSNCALDDLPTDLMEEYLNKSTLIYTKSVVSKASKGFFNTVTSKIIDDKIKSLHEDLSVKTREYNRKVVELCNDYVPLRSLTARQKANLKPELDQMNSVREEYKKHLRDAKSSTRMNVVKISCGKRSSAKQAFDFEMSHFKKTGSEYRGVGELNTTKMAKLHEYFKELPNQLVRKGFNTEKFRDVYNEGRGPGPEFFTEQKNGFQANWDIFQKNLKGTLLDQLTTIVSRLCHTLFVESTRTFNKDFLKVDNLGLTNFLVIIRGGSKIYKNQTSKLFKVMFYCSLDDFEICGYKENDHFECFPSAHRCLVVTPWMQLHQDTLLDGLSFRHRTFMNLYTGQVRCKAPLDGEIPKINLLPSILFLHNRRKTEKFMHNCRYLIVNPLATHANLTGIIKSFADFNYTFLDAWLRDCISTKYCVFSEKLSLISANKTGNADGAISDSGILDLWFDEPLNNTDHLTSFIYATYMMTKAPVNSSVEQSSNLWEILEDVLQFETNHGDVDGLNDISIRFDVRKFQHEIYKDDFKYDPVFCQYLGYRMGSFLNQAVGKTAIANHWSSIKLRCVDSLANSNGLRGWNSENFFNKKGYEIVYQKVLETLENNDVDLEELIEEYIKQDPHTASNNVKADMMNFTKSEESLNQIVFHVVQKIQRGGGREIFCMDLNTKEAQYPLEQFFKFLCKQIPQEFISIPSGKRSNIIHSDFFERGPGSWVKQITRWVLDCRRWAPHSVFQKYMHFIHGMCPILPNDFTNQFMSFGNKMFKKRFYTREHVLSKMRNNERFTPFKKFIVKDDKINGAYFFNAKFSFVMGIFNYLSTLLHAANQMLAGELIRDYCLSNDLGLVSIDAKCHSDDSVVSVHHEKVESINPCIALYDWWLKGANHMLSVKKSQINNNVYLEFLSTLYLFDRLLPVYPKFTSSLPFSPSDNGYASDITFAVTQSIEMVTHGGTFEEAFLMLKVTENYIQGLYNIKPDYNLPYHFFGGLDAHPLELLLAGSDCEIYKHLKFNSVSVSNAIKHLSNQKLINLKEVGTFSLSWDMGARLDTKLKKKYLRYKTVTEKINSLCPWTMTNCKLGNQFLNFIWYLNKLQDPKYYSSLISEPSARRYSRIFGSFAHRCVRNSEGILYKVDDLSRKLSIVCSEVLEGEVIDMPIYNYLCEDLEQLYESLSDLKIISLIPNNMKDKPVFFSVKSMSLGTEIISPNEYVVFKKESEAYPLLGRMDNPIRRVTKVDDRLTLLGMDIDSMSPDDLFKVSSRILGKDNKSYRIIANVESSNRKISGMVDTLSLLETNSIRHKRYKFKFNKARIVDWNRSVLKGKVPQSVTDCMENFFAIKTIEKLGGQNLPIFKTDPVQTFNQSFQCLPSDWKPVISALTFDQGGSLMDRFYWSFWDKEQVKLSNNWFGQGSCFVNIPESLIKITILNGVTTEILIDCQPCIFSVPSTWYIQSLLSQVGMVTEWSNTDFVSADINYLGYDDKRGLMGFGRRNEFTKVVVHSKSQEIIGPDFFYRESSLINERNHKVLCDLDVKRKIYFFTPHDDNVYVDLSRFVDKELVKLNRGDKKVMDFCHQIAIELDLQFEFNKQTVIDNMGKTTLYKIVQNHPDSRKTFDRSQIVKDNFFESLMLWKEKHRDFGFPDKEELKKLFKSSDTAPLPLAIQDVLFKLGETDLSDEEYSNIVQRLYLLEGEDRAVYVSGLMNSFDPQVTKGLLTIIKKSDRIFEMCSCLGRESLSIIEPFVHSLLLVMEETPVYSQTLQEIQSRMSPLGIKLSVASVLREVINRTVIDGLLSEDILSSKVKIANLFFKIMDELIANGICFHLGSINLPGIMSTIDFSGPTDPIMSWIIDIFDSLYTSRSPKPSRILEARNNDFVGERGVWTPILKSLRAQVSKSKIILSPKSLNVTRRSSSKKNLRKFRLEADTREVPGLTFIPFVPLAVHSYDEIMPGMELTEADLVDFEFDPDFEIRELTYVRVPCLNLENLQSFRGNARNIIIGCNVVSEEVLSIRGFVTLFKKSEYSNLKTFVNSYSDLLVLISVGKNYNLSIEGYERMSWENTNIFLRNNSFESPDIKILGKKHKKKDFLSSSYLKSHYLGIEDYYGTFSQSRIDRELKSKELLLSVTDEKNVVVDEKFNKHLADFRKLVSEYKEQEVTASDEETKEVEAETEVTTNEATVSMQEVLTNVIRELENLDVVAVKTKERQKSLKPNFLKFKDPINVLNDEATLGQLNALFPGYAKKIMNKEIRLSKRTKDKKVALIKMIIKGLPYELVRKYQMLSLVCFSVLDSIDECEYLQHEDLEFASLVEDLFILDLSTSKSADEFFDSTPDPDIIRMQADIDILF